MRLVHDVPLSLTIYLIWRFGNKNFFGYLDFLSTIGKDNADLEVVTKQIAAVVDVIFAPHGNPEISDVRRFIKQGSTCEAELLLIYTKEARIRSRQR